MNSNVCIIRLRSDSLTCMRSAALLKMTLQGVVGEFHMYAKRLFSTVTLRYINAVLFSFIVALINHFLFINNRNKSSFHIFSPPLSVTGSLHLLFIRIH